MWLNQLRKTSLARWAVLRLWGGILVLLGLVTTNANGQTLTTLTSFNGSDGQWPLAGLTLIGNTLYGTTEEGGANGYGTVFSLPLSGGTPTTIATFTGSNGWWPMSDLTLSGDTLYGVTAKGGAHGDGTVFSVPASGGTPNVLVSFDWGATMTTYPYGSLTLSGSTLYGTAINGGVNNIGAVFSVPLSGVTPTILTSFTGAGASDPWGGLTLSGSMLYGVAGTAFTAEGGTVFALPVSGGTPTVLASFNGSNGIAPFGNLTLSGSALYGSTVNGGIGYNEGEPGDGVIFRVPTSGGTPAVLAAFNGSDGSGPNGSLTLVGNTLYGTAVEGGVGYNGSYRSGYGVVFSVPVSGGTPTVLASFDDSNGAGPCGGLTLVGNTLFGTTNGGGAYGYGTVFALTLPPSNWTSAANGNWSNSSNWTGSVPNGVGAGAALNVATTAAVTVTLDMPVTLGSLQFGNSGSASVGYTLSGIGTNTLTLSNSGSGATITVTNGTHAIDAPVILADDLIVTSGGTNPWTLSFGTAEQHHG